MADVQLNGLRKIYGGARTHIAVHNIDLQVADGEFVVLVGPSGCGKSTILRMIAGLEAISEGELSIGGVRMNEIAPGDRDIAMVFQTYALYPHMTVAENLAFALKLRGLPAADIEKRVQRAAHAMHIESLLSRRPRALSGGERQRVALGRALVREPKVFLFDEPLSNLDARLRVEMRREIARLHRELRATMIYVTHDQVEAMTLGDRIVVLRDGRVQQVDTPGVLYETPRNVFVAGFIGSPSMNIIEGDIVRDGDTLSTCPCRCGGRQRSCRTSGNGCCWASGPSTCPSSPATRSCPAMRRARNCWCVSISWSILATKQSCTAARANSS
jgi:multiple sugar transport system ATP-binding protein